jgi:diguanylate cyclase (GGDEF)-like protein
MVDSNFEEGGDLVERKLAHIILVGSIFIFITGLIILTRGVSFLWHLYYVPLFLGALLLGEVGGVSLAILSSGAIFSFLFLFPSSDTVLQRHYLMEVSIASAVMLVGGISLGWFARAQKRNQAFLHQSSMTDRLTGLRNYAYFAERLEEERKRADRFGSHLALIMLDIDYFKPFNDRFGHAKGNLLLKKLAQIMKGEVRSVDVVSRYGGEEFAIILPNTNGEAVRVAERIRKAVQKAGFEGDSKEPVIEKTISAGVAVYPIHCDNEIELIDKADMALCRAKESGRNQVCLYNSKIDKEQL